MSGFYGELSLKGNRVAPEDLAAMDSAMSYWGPDASGRWQEGPIALGAPVALEWRAAGGRWRRCGSNG